MERQQVALVKNERGDQAEKEISNELAVHVTAGVADDASAIGLHYEVDAVVVAEDDDAVGLENAEGQSPPLTVLPDRSVAGRVERRGPGFVEPQRQVR
jgi:hypothetical protein